MRQWRPLGLVLAVLMPWPTASGQERTLTLAAGSMKTIPIAPGTPVSVSITLDPSQVSEFFAARVVVV